MRVFISYSPEDAATQDELVGQMQLVLPHVEFRYEQATDRGTLPWWERVQQNLAGSDLFLLLLSENWLNSEWNRKEYSLARKLEKKIVTVKISPTVRVPNALQQYPVFDVSNGIEASDDSDALFAALGVVPGAPADELDARPMTTTPIPFDDLNPAPRPGVERVEDDLLAPGVTISPAPEAPDPPAPVRVPAPAPEPSPAAATTAPRLPLFSVITLLTFVAVITGIVLISLDVLELGLIILLGGVVAGAILSLVVFIQRRL